MNRSPVQSFGRRSALLLLAALLLLLPIASRADTVASLLGDFTINQYCGLGLTQDAVKLHYVAVYGQLPALRELHLADVDGDGVTTQAERDAYVQKLAPGIADQLVLTVDGVAVPLRATGWTSSLPTEQTGFSLRVDVDFSGSLPAVPAAQSRAIRFDNRNDPGKIGWHEIAVEAGPGLAVFDTDAFSTSMTAGLTEALRALPASGPLDERSVHLSFRQGDLPAGAAPIQARPGQTTPAAGTAAATVPANSGSAWLRVQTKRLIDVISAPKVAPGVLALALLLAMVLGALHAFSPGHGKTIVGAYLVGSRGTPRHALFLGVTVTVTHTLVVFALGLATLFASRFVIPEKLFPVLSLISGLLILGMGLVLLAQRSRIARDALLGLRDGGLGGFSLAAASAGHRHSHGHSHGHGHDGHEHDGHEHSDAHSHRHEEEHGHEHVHHSHHAAQGDHALVHSHGGRAHSHVPPSDAITWRGLLALGVSGGLLPCPSAMVLLLAAVALQKTAYGLLLVVAFSIGLALTLTGVGLVFLYARNRFGRRLGNSPWLHALPVLSALLITGVGAVLCFSALATQSI